MQVDALAVRLRPRTTMEAADLGVRVCQAAARSVYPAYLAVALPVMVLAIASYDLAPWLPSVAIWCAKPWLDRTILFALSRAVFNQPTRPADVWRARRQVWWRQLLFTWTVQRLSFWRSLTQPVYQLEGGSIWSARRRVRQLRRGAAGAAFLTTEAFSFAELALLTGVVSLLFWFAPAGRGPDAYELFFGEAPALAALTIPIAYALVVLFLEPFYVAAGFALYLNRRAELEAWDIEQEFRHAFGE
jgi:hypothetical protein